MNKLTMFLISCLCASCAVVPKAAQCGDALPNLSGLDMAPINFRSGQPEGDNKLLASIDGVTAEQSLERDLNIVKKYSEPEVSPRFPW